MSENVIIVGAGLAGLCCARRLQEEGIPFLLLEAADAVGGRVRTDRIEGFQLDRGFQVLLTSYPEAQRMLDYEALQLKSFLPGALVRFQGQFHRVTDPWRRPLAALGSVVSPIGTITDKLRVGSLRSRCLKGTVDDQFQVPETTTLEALQGAGFTASMIDRFFKPFLGGIFLDSTLNTSSRMFHFVFRMFATGSASLPAAGMEAIPRQLAAALPADTVRLHTRVATVEPQAVTLESGERMEAHDVVVAVDGSSAARLLGDADPPVGQGVTCFYFAAPKSPRDEPILILNGDGSGPINNLCVPTAVVPSYGPGDQSLVSATVLGADADPEQLREQVRSQLVEWFGASVRDWRHLQSYRIPYALPNQFAPALDEPQRGVRRQSNLYICGDHRDNASIQGAMVSGRRTAEAILEDRA